MKHEIIQVKTEASSMCRLFDTWEKAIVIEIEKVSLLEFLEENKLT